MKTFLPIIPAIGIWLLASCASRTMDGTKISSESEVRATMGKLSENHPSFAAKEGEEFQIYGPWKSKFGEGDGSQLKIGDRLWQVVYMGADGTMKTVWLNAESGNARIMSGSQEDL